MSTPVLGDEFKGYAVGPTSAADLSFRVSIDSGDGSTLPTPIEVATAIAEVFTAAGFTSVSFYGTATQTVPIYPQPAPEA
jgi:hypothetical protein